MVILAPIDDKAVASDTSWSSFLILVLYGCLDGRWMLGTGFLPMET